MSIAPSSGTLKFVGLVVGAIVIAGYLLNIAATNNIPLLSDAKKGFS